LRSILSERERDQGEKLTAEISRYTWRIGREEISPDILQAMSLCLREEPTSAALERYVADDRGEPFIPTTPSVLYPREHSLSTHCEERPKVWSPVLKGLGN